MSAVAPFPVPPIVKSVLVRRPPEETFRRFTDGLGRWWPLAGFHLAPDPARCVMEPGVGGRLYETSTAGVETDWGVVRAWEPPHRLAFSFNSMKHPGVASEVEVVFSAAAEGTEVRLTHSGWERFGDAAERARNQYDGGWVTVFGKAFADFANGPA
jgi:uncharacterized protein YndB with AHSA1/START domain